MAEKELGAETADDLTHRLEDLAAARSIADLILGDPTVVKASGSARDELHLGLLGDRTLVFVENHVETPRRQTGETDWARVARIKLRSIR